MAAKNKKEFLCDRCTALCCRYFALQIDTPKTPDEFDDIRWYLAHENVHVFIEEKLWYLAIQTRCRHLQEDNRCGIYEDRPRICRQYDADTCDYHIGAYDFEQYFTAPEQLEAYAQATLGRAYHRYALKQRHKNTGRPGHALHHVLLARARPKVKGHPHARQPRRPRSAPKSCVRLSISAPKR